MMRIMFRRGIVWFLMALVSMSMLAACGSAEKSQPKQAAGEGSTSGEKVIELRIWHMEEPPEWAARFQEVFDAYSKANPNVKVKVEIQNWGTAWEKTLAAVQAKNQPDLLFTIPDFTTTVKSTGIVQPVDDLVSELNQKHKFLPSATGPYYYEGHHWAVPLYGMLQVLWYRKDFFAEAGIVAPPKTWEELVSTAKALTKNGRYGIAVPASKTMATDQTIYTFMATSGAEDLFDASGNVRFDNPGTVKAFELYNELVKYSPPDVTSWGWGEPRDAFYNGSVAMAVEKGWYLGDWEKTSGKKPAEIGVAPVPVPAGGKNGSIYIPNGAMLLSQDPQKQAAAKDLIRFILEPDNYGRFVNASPALFLPLTEDGFQSKTWLADPIIKTYGEQMKVLVEQSKNGQLYGFSNGKVFPAIGKISAQNIMAQAVQKMVVEKSSPAEAVKWGQKAMQEAIK